MLRLKMSPGLIAILLVAIVLAGTMAQAATVFVQPAAAEGVDLELRTTVVELVKAAVSEEPGFSLATNAKEADLQLNSKLLKLGGSYFVAIDKYKGEKLVFTSKMKATNAEDLDTVAARVVRSTLREMKVEETAQVDNVTEDETTRNTRRTEATRQWKFGFGPAWGDQMNTDKSGLVYTLGFIWGIDSHFDLDLALRGASFQKSGESGSSFTEFLIGTNYYLSRGQNALFLTGGVGRAAGTVSTSNSILFSDDVSSGWSARVGVGYKFFRTSTVNLGVELNYSKIFAESSKSKNSPGLTTATLALYY